MTILYIIAQLSRGSHNVITYLEEYKGDETMTTTKNETARVNTLDIREYMPQILAIKKNTLKFSISKIEELSDLTEILFNQRITNINENISVGFSDNKNYQSKFQLRAQGKIFTIYSNVSDSKIRAALKA